MTLVIAGCSRRKRATDAAVPALELYEGGAVPRLRERVAGRPDRRARVWLLSAEHGLVHADQRLLPYDRLLTLDRAQQLRRSVGETAAAALTTTRATQVLALLEPLYVVCLADLLAVAGHPQIRWVPDPVNGWDEAARVLDGWGWT